MKQLNPKHIKIKHFNPDDNLSFDNEIIYYNDDQDEIACNFSQNKSAIEHISISDQSNLNLNHSDFQVLEKSNRITIHNNNNIPDFTNNLNNLRVTNISDNSSAHSQERQAIAPELQQIQNSLRQRSNDSFIHQKDEILSIRKQFNSEKVLHMQSLLDTTISKLKQSQKDLEQSSEQKQLLKRQIQTLKQALQNINLKMQQQKSNSQFQKRQTDKIKAVHSKRSQRMIKITKDLHILLQCLKESNQYMTESVGIMQQGKQFDQKVVVALTQLDCQDQGIYRQEQMLDQLFQDICGLLQKQIIKNNKYLNDAPFHSWDFNSDDQEEEDDDQKTQRNQQDCNESRGIFGYQTAASSDNITLNPSNDQILRTQSRQTSRRGVISGATPKFKKGSVHIEKVQVRESSSAIEDEDDDQEDKSVPSSQCSSPFGKKSTLKKNQKRRKKDEKYDPEDLKLIIKHLAFKFGNSACNLNTVDAFLQRMRKQIAEPNSLLDQRKSAVYPSNSIISTSEFKLLDNSQNQEVNLYKKRSSIVDMKDAFTHQKQIQKLREAQNEVQQQVNKLQEKLQSKQVEIAKLKGKLIEKQTRCSKKESSEQIVDKLQKLLKTQSQKRVDDYRIELIFGKDIASALSKKIASKEQESNLQTYEYKEWIKDIQKLIKFQNKIFEVTKILSQDIRQNDSGVPPRVIIQSKTLKQDFPQDVQIQMDRQVNQKLLDIHNRQNSNNDKQHRPTQPLNSGRRVTFDGISQFHYFSNQSDIANQQEQKINSTLTLEDDDQSFREAVLLPLQRESRIRNSQNDRSYSSIQLHKTLPPVSTTSTQTYEIQTLDSSSNNKDILQMLVAQSMAFEQHILLQK